MRSDKDHSVLIVSPVRVHSADALKRKADDKTTSSVLSVSRIPSPTPKESLASDANKAGVHNMSPESLEYWDGNTWFITPMDRQ